MKTNSIKGLDALKASLAEAGWGIFSMKDMNDEAADWRARKTVLELSADDHIVYLSVTPRIVSSEDSNISLVDISITGFYGDSAQWISLQVKYLRPSEVMPNLQSIARKLTAAWEALDSGG